MAGEWRRWTKHKVTVTVHIKRWLRGGFDMIEVMQHIVIESSSQYHTKLQDIKLTFFVSHHPQT